MRHFSNEIGVNIYIYIFKLIGVNIKVILIICIAIIYNFCYKNGKIKLRIQWIVNGIIIQVDSNMVIQN